jgi:hypothetical protein
MKTISSQAKLLCLICLCAYQPTIKPSSSAIAAVAGGTINQRADVSPEQMQSGMKEQQEKYEAQLLLNPDRFSDRVRQIIAIKKHLATALSFNQPANIDAIMDSFISLEQILSAAQTALKIYALDNELRSNIQFLQQLQRSIETSHYELSININPIKEAFYSLSFIKKLITQDMVNKKLSLDEAASTTQLLQSNQDFKAAILALQKDAAVRALRPDAINWNNIEIVFDALVKTSASTAAAHQSSTLPIASPATNQQPQGWVAWLRSRM